MPYGKLVGATLIAGVHCLGGAEIVSHLLLCQVHGEGHLQEEGQEELVEDGFGLLQDQR